MDNVGIVVTARVNSNRLKEKVFQTINGKLAIEILLDHLANKNYPVILAIPGNKEDDELEKIGVGKGIEVYRGQDDSPLHRLYECAIENNFDHVVRITTDDILIDMSLLLKQIQFHLHGKLDYTYMRRCPEGVAGEVYKVDALERVIEDRGDEPCEFVSYLLKNKDFYYKEYYPPYEYQFTFRLTMDYPEDLVLLKVLHACLREPFGTLDIINFIKRNKYLLQINHQPSVSVFTSSHNMGKYICDCMSSVINQTYQDYEYLVYDDCSQDGTIETIYEYYDQLPYEQQEKMKIFRNSNNIGLAATSNKALETAKGKYIMRVDADDVLDPQALEAFTEKMKMEDVQVVFSAYDEVDKNLNHMKTITENRKHPGCCLLSTWCVNELKFKEDLRFMEGEEFFDRFDLLYNSSFIKTPLWQYRQHGEQKTKSQEHPKNENIDNRQ